MQGQANVFFRYFPEKLQSAIDRYQNETKRLYTVLDTQLKGRDFICDELTIADFATFPWVNIHEWSGVEISHLKNLSAWVERCRERPCFKAGLNVPKRPDRKDVDPEEVKKAAAKMLQKQFLLNLNMDSFENKIAVVTGGGAGMGSCLLYTSPSPRDRG